MKKRTIPLFLIVLFSLVGCRDVTTGVPRNTEFHADDTITVSDMDTGEKVLTLVIDSATVVSSEPREIEVVVGETSSGTKEVKTITVNQTVEVRYSYTYFDSGLKSLDENHFKLLDDRGCAAYTESGTADSSYSSSEKIVHGRLRFALGHTSSQPKLEFRYNVLNMKPTAMIALNLSGTHSTAPESAQSSPSQAEGILSAPQPNAESASSAPEPAAPESPEPESARPLSSSDSNVSSHGGEENQNKMIWIVVIGSMSALILFLIMCVIQSRIKLARIQRENEHTNNDPPMP